MFDADPAIICKPRDAGLFNDGRDAGLFNDDVMRACGNSAKALRTHATSARGTKESTIAKMDKTSAASSPLRSILLITRHLSTYHSLSAKTERLSL